MAKSLFVFLLGGTLLLSAGTGVHSFAAELVNINTADKTALTSLSGIGDVKAQAIIDYRTSHGPFGKIEDIMNVSGIGTATFNNIKDSITVGTGTQAQTTTQSESTSQQASTSTQSSTQTTPTSAPVSSYVAPPEPQVFADAGSDRIVIVGADTVFNGTAYNRKKEPVDHVRFMWNFGDGSTAEGMNVRHHYAYPGRYAVVLDIAEGMNSASAHIVVTAEPARLAFTVPSDGSVSIENRAGRDLDLTGWIVRQFGQFFVLPEHSIILEGETIRIPQTTLKFWSSVQTELAYPNGIVALHANESTDASPTIVSAPAIAPVVVSVPVTESVSRTRIYTLENTSPEPTMLNVEEAATTSPHAQTAAAMAATDVLTYGGSTYWWIGTGALGFLGAVAVYIIRRVKAGEWDIVEET